MPSRRRTFVIGLIAGAVGAASMLILATLGALVGLPLLVIGLFIPPRLYGASGTLIGFGGAVVLLYGRIALTCTPPECQGPSATPFLVAGAVSLGSGLVLLAIGTTRRPR
jgi:hypothetical protein